MYKAFTFFSLLYLTIDASNNDKIKIIMHVQDADVEKKIKIFYPFF